MSKSEEKHKILLICTYFNFERTKRRKQTFLQSMVGSHIYSLIDHQKYDMKLHHENWHGPYNIDASAEAFDIVILTGLQQDFDRMRQLSYVFQKRGSLVVAGGNLCTMFPEFAKEFFDVVFVGGVECIFEFTHDFENTSLKSIYRSPQNQIGNYSVDFEIIRKSGIRSTVHFIEASRGCNFKCDFCVIAAEKSAHATYRIDNVVKSINSAIENSSWFSLRKLFPLIFFIDNNFSNNIPYMKEICAYLKDSPKIRAWGALVTQNTLQNHDVIKLLSESKCKVLFTGIESFDANFLDAHDKRQNVQALDQLIHDVRFAQSQGIAIYYPYMLDPRISSIEDMRKQIDMLLSNDYLAFPNFFTTVSPLVGTKLFWESLQKGELLPNLRLRDLDGQSLCYRNTVDSCDKYSEFLLQLYCNKNQPVNHVRHHLKVFKGMCNLGSRNPISLLLFFMGSFSHFNMTSSQPRHPTRNYIGGQDILDPQYQEYPDGITSADKQKYFDPIMITDANGDPSSWLQYYNPHAAPLHPD
jgi:radical SAM superfamily enzyme YgiQ (UPF0313 family)